MIDLIATHLLPTVQQILMPNLHLTFDTPGAALPRHVIIVPRSHDVVHRSPDHDASHRVAYKIPQSCPLPAHHLLLHYHNHHSSYHFIMSDQGRQSLTGKATKAAKVPSLSIMTISSVNTALIFQPDSEKSTFEHLGDKMEDKVDSVASKVQPEVYICYVFNRSTCSLDFRYRVKSPQARKPVTHSSMETRRAV